MQSGADVNVLCEASLIYIISSSYIYLTYENRDQQKVRQQDRNHLSALIVLTIIANYNINATRFNPLLPGKK